MALIFWRRVLANAGQYFLGVGQQTIAGTDKDAASKVAAINASVQRGDIDPEAAQKQIQPISQERDAAREKVQKGIGDPLLSGRQWGSLKILKNMSFIRNFLLQL